MSSNSPWATQEAHADVWSALPQHYDLSRNSGLRRHLPFACITLSFIVRKRRCAIGTRKSSFCHRSRRSRPRDKQRQDSRVSAAVECLRLTTVLVHLFLLSRLPREHIYHFDTLQERQGGSPELMNRRMQSIAWIRTFAARKWSVICESSFVPFAPLIWNHLLFIGVNAHPSPSNILVLSTTNTRLKIPADPSFPNLSLRQPWAAFRNLKSMRTVPQLGIPQQHYPITRSLNSNFFQDQPHTLAAIGRE